MSFTAGGLVPWTVRPDWRNPVRETLAWRNSMLRASATGVSYHCGQRIAPGRTFAFDVVDQGQAWRLADALLQGNGGRTFQLPIWPDEQTLTTPAASGAESIACGTAGFDFVAGGRAILWRGVNRWEVVSIETVEPAALALSAPLVSDWPAGSLLYPLRTARVQNGAQETVWGGGDKGHRNLVFTIHEPCDWPAIAPAASYLGHPVLEWRPNAGQDESGSYQRLLEEVDNELGDPAVFDLAGIALRGTGLAWKLFGRQEHSDYRSLLYWLSGNLRPVWVPSWKQDFVVVSPIGAAATALTVEWVGYTVLGHQQPNRRDLRIELFDGTVFYRRIVGSAEVGGNEQLQLNSALGESIDPGQIRDVSYLVLSTTTDSTEIEHVTDASGAARVGLTFNAVVPDV